MMFDHTKDYGKDRFAVRQGEYNSWGIWDCMKNAWHSSGRWSSKSEAIKSLNALKKRHRK